MGSSLVAVVAAFLVFEVCVGMYFPSIGTLRSRYIPESHRSVIVNIFGIPLNLIVVAVFLFDDSRYLRLFGFGSTWAGFFERSNGSNTCRLRSFLCLEPISEANLETGKVRISFRLCQGFRCTAVGIHLSSLFEALFVGFDPGQKTTHAATGIRPLHGEELGGPPLFDGLA